ncbi:hypothetical protein PsYK624_172770 [Phanerochaete sordida]|uniref:Uncharacterized protein n=1 Tax=Phanerochaete sordida TaxID=48140 RepID=A0A9P3GSW6_9APHY|nr:hypothetical protein PsYK624_172770 [Phanerochaete sordida]
MDDESSNAGKGSSFKEQGSPSLAPTRDTPSDMGRGDNTEPDVDEQSRSQDTPILNGPLESAKTEDTGLGKGKAKNVGKGKAKAKNVGKGKGNGIKNVPKVASKSSTTGRPRKTKEPCHRRAHCVQWKRDQSKHVKNEVSRPSALWYGLPNTEADPLLHMCSKRLELLLDPISQTVPKLLLQPRTVLRLPRYRRRRGISP